MKKEVAKELFKEKGIVIIPQYKKIWYSITKFEKYPEMAAEGTGRAILYLTKLILIFVAIISVGLCIKLSFLLNSSVDYVEKNISNLNYQDGNLEVELLEDRNEFITDIGTVIIDTKSTSFDKNISSDGLEIIWLKDHVIVSENGNKTEFYYKEIMNDFGITSFNKADLLDFISNNISSPRIYIAYFVVMLLYLMVTYFFLTLMDVIMLSIFGVLTSMIAKIRMRYRAIFNMSVYSITISVILELIYMLINVFTKFEIKYFDLMYTAIAYICLTAAIFMIKSDVIKQHIELMKIIKEKEKENQRQEEQSQEKKENNDVDNEESEDKKETKDEDLDNEAEGQESNA